MNRADQARRDNQMALERIAGRTEAEVAAHHGVSVRTVRRALRGYRETSGLIGVEPDPLYEADLHLGRLESLISQLAIEVQRAKTPRARGALISKQARLLHRQLILLQDLGMVPRLSLAEERQAMREEHGAQLYAWIRKHLKENADVLGPWLGELVEQWIEQGDQGALARQRDTFRLESVLWKDAGEAKPKAA